MTLLVFDIETIPDVETGRRLYDLQGLSDEDTAKAYRLSQANAMIRWRNHVSQNEELFMESASEEDKTLYKQLNNLM